ncbi:MAG: Gldg family protein [Eubacteriales bacterium]|nr:Gldg family protein [Eubacteriales bacterium]
MEDNRKKLVEKILEENNDKKTKKSKRDKKADKRSAGPVVDRRNRSLKLISVSSALLFIAIVMVFNFVFDSLLGSRLKWDWSQTDMYSIGGITEKLLGDLDKEVRIIGLFDEGTGQMPEAAKIEILLEKYEQKSSGLVSVEYINPVKTPSIITAIDPDGVLKPRQNDFAIWCEDTGKVKILGVYDLLKIGYDQSYNQTIEGVTAEEAISGAILYVSSEETPVVYMTKGQGEEDYTQTFTAMMTLIRNNNFEVKDLDMLTTSEIPEDARLLIMLNPVSDINAAGRKALENYLKKGRSLLVMTEFNNYTFPVLNSLLADYNIEISNDRIREGDKDRRFSDNGYIFLADAATGMISEQSYDKMTLIMNARNLNLLRNTKEWIKVENFIVTGDQASLEPEGDIEASKQPGVATVAIASENSGFMDGANVTEAAKVLVIGSSGFMSDSILNYYGTQVYNMYAFYGSLNWLVDSNIQDLVITPKELPSYLLKSGNNTGYWAAAVFAVIIIPIGLFVTALVVFRKRKNL